MSLESRHFRRARPASTSDFTACINSEAGAPRRPRQGCGSARSAFTLIELLVVIA
ncbi:MAG: type II secretion system protein, partial [Limisphaerales bacterium]